MGGDSFETRYWPLGDDWYRDRETGERVYFAPSYGTMITVEEATNETLALLKKHLLPLLPKE